MKTFNIPVEERNANLYVGAMLGKEVQCTSMYKISLINAVLSSDSYAPVTEIPPLYDLTHINV